VFTDLTMQLRLTLAGAVAALLAGAATAHAQTPALTPLNACYVSATQTAREPVGLEGANFQPNVPLDVFVDEVLQPQDPANPPMTDVLGKIEGSVMAPYVASGQRSFTVRLAEQSPRTGSASATSKVTALSVTQSPQKPSTTSTRVRFRLRGFTNKLLPVYAHYVLKGKVRQTVQIGKPYGDCGLVSVRRRQFPFAHPQTGSWTIQFDQEQVYNPNAIRYTRLPVRVKRKPRPRDQTAAGSSAPTRVRSNTSSPSSASTLMWSPAVNSPLSRPSASGSTRRLEMIRFSGRAPYVGS
jgi:hypothetical protein